MTTVGGWERLTVPYCVRCPKCSFTISAEQMAVDGVGDGSGWWCHNCESILLRARLAVAEAQVRESIAQDFARMAGDRAPHLSAEENRRYSDWNANVADRIRHPDRYSGVAAAPHPALGAATPDRKDETR